MRKALKNLVTECYKSKNQHSRPEMREAMEAGETVLIATKPAEIVEVTSGPRILSNQDLDDRFAFLSKWLKGSIMSGVYRDIDSLFTYGFICQVKYRGDNWHFGLNESSILEDREIEWMTVSCKISPSPKVNITKEDFIYLKKEFKINSY